MAFFPDTESVLCKRGMRNDLIWTHTIPFRIGLVKRIPVYLDTHALLESQYWPREKLFQLQKIRLQEVVRAAAQIPLWYWRFIKSNFGYDSSLDYDAFQRLPLNTKKDFENRHYTSYTAPIRYGELIVSRTSGSTGTPLKFYQDGSYELRQYGICGRMLQTAAAGDSQAPVVATRVRIRPGFSLDPRHFFFVQGYNSIRHRLPELVRHLQTYNERVTLYGFSSAMLELARACSELEVQLPVKSIVASGETLQISQREEIKEAFRADVFLCYTTSELGWLGFECEHHRIHINEESFYVEITDNNGTPLPEEAEGKIVVTPFDTRVMPFIRYDTGDRGSISNEFCPCGRTLRTIKVLGRQIAYLSFADNRIVSLLDLSSAFDAYSSAVRQFQVIQTSDDSITVRIVPRKKFDAIKEKLARRLTALIHPKLHMGWEMVENIPEGPNGKAVYFVRAIPEKNT